MFTKSAITIGLLGLAQAQSPITLGTTFPLASDAAANTGTVVTMNEYGYWCIRSG